MILFRRNFCCCCCCCCRNDFTWSFIFRREKNAHMLAYILCSNCVLRWKIKTIFFYYTHFFLFLYYSYTHAQALAFTTVFFFSWMTLGIFLINKVFALFEEQPNNFQDGFCYWFSKIYWSVYLARAWHTDHLNCNWMWYKYYMKNITSL